MLSFCEGGFSGEGGDELDERRLGVRLLHSDHDDEAGGEEEGWESVGREREEEEETGRGREARMRRAEKKVGKIG